MRGKALIAVCFVIVAVPVLFAQKSGDQVVAESVADPNAEAFNHFYNLDYEIAIKEFRDFTVTNPQSADGWNYVAQAIFYSAMFNCGLMGSDLVKDNNTILHSAKVTLTPERDREMQAALDKAEGLAHAKLQQNPNDTRALYSLGVSYGLRANYELLGKHAWLAGLKAANESRKLNEQIIKLDPNNYDARLVPGTHQYMVGTLPLFARLAARAAGVTGNRAEGLQKVELAATRGERDRLDAQILLAVLYRREGKSALGIPILQAVSDSYPRNFIFKIELAKLYVDTGDRAHAVSELDCIDRMMGQSAPGYTGDRVAMIRQKVSEVGQRVAQLPQPAPSELASASPKVSGSASLLK